MPSDFQLFPLLGVNFLNSYLSAKVVVSNFTFPMFFSFYDSRSFAMKKKDTLFSIAEVCIFLGDNHKVIFWGFFLVEEKTDE